MSQSHGSAEALEAVLADLPSAVHSRDNVRYMAGQLVRSLPTGRALVNYVGKRGMVSAILRVPLVSDDTVDRAGFDSLRTEVLSGSSSAMPADRAAELVAIREQLLLRSCKVPEEPEPVSFRTEAPPIAPGHDRSPPDASGRRRTRPSSKPKTVE